MKVYIVVCLVFIANVLGQAKSDEQQEKFHKLNQECGKLAGITDQALLAKIEAYTAYPEDDKMKVMSKCLFTGVGIIDAEGKVNTEAFTAILKSIVPGKETDIIKKCVADKQTAGKDAFVLGKCAYVEIVANRA